MYISLNWSHFVLNSYLYLKGCAFYKQIHCGTKKSFNMHECITDFTDSNGKINFDMKYLTNVCNYQNMHVFSIFDINKAQITESWKDSTFKCIWRCINFHCLEFSKPVPFMMSPFTITWILRMICYVYHSLYILSWTYEKPVNICWYNFMKHQDLTKTLVHVKRHIQMWKYPQLEEIKWKVAKYVAERWYNPPSFIFIF